MKPSIRLFNEIRRLTEERPPILTEFWAKRVVVVTYFWSADSDAELRALLQKFGVKLRITRGTLKATNALISKSAFAKAWVRLISECAAVVFEDFEQPELPEGWGDVE